MRFSARSSFIIREFKVRGQLGFSLVELLLVLGLSGLLMGSLGLIWGSFLKETAPQAIVLNDYTHEIAPSFKVAMDAFDFHSVFLSFLEKSELCLSFGGTISNDFRKHRFLPINNDFDFANLLRLKPLTQGKFLTTKSLLESGETDIQAFFEKMAPDSDSASDSNLTCVLLGREAKDSAFVQLRAFCYVLENELYNVYSVVIYSMENRQELKSYRYAVKSAEDPYADCDLLKRFFYDEPEERARESFNIVVFPDPYALANNEERKDDLNSKSLSRFTYVLDVF
ncbi:hypothetical protein AYO37_00155 [Opitutia bacterium SCGC AG-212-L18]|nr:hypothetical protein AYO37_00155 [Opitutae bacterium SCGC AG-212-L18]